MKLKKSVLKGQELLSIEEMKLFRGGDKVNTGCEGKSRENCGGDCVGGGIYPGSCGWTAGNYNRCTCGYVVIES